MVTQFVSSTSLLPVKILHKGMVILFQSYQENYFLCDIFGDSERINGFSLFSRRKFVARYEKFVTRTQCCNKLSSYHEVPLYFEISYTKKKFQFTQFLIGNIWTYRFQRKFHAGNVRSCKKVYSFLFSIKSIVVSSTIEKNLHLVENCAFVLEMYGQAHLCIHSTSTFKGKHHITRFVLPI